MSNLKNNLTTVISGLSAELEKYGFKKCGIIYLANGDPRIAYQMKK